MFQKNCYYVAIEKVYELTITNCNIIMTLQTSRTNRAIKSRKQQSTLITAEGRRAYWKSRLSRTFQTTKGVETSKAVTLRHTS